MCTHVFDMSIYGSHATQTTKFVDLNWNHITGISYLTSQALATRADQLHTASESAELCWNIYFRWKPLPQSSQVQQDQSESFPGLSSLGSYTWESRGSSRFSHHENVQRCLPEPSHFDHSRPLF
mmetsp:Transcript_66719/g.104224  ORF Transcript_66719/g.104224 Transcript_66719/m.104224 type:complete len:124 (+) Transcript_66719:67-438(+)